MAERRAVARQAVAMVTGASGFVGTHLVEALLRDTDWLVVGFGRRRPPIEDRRVRYLKGDVLDGATVVAALTATRPDVVFHLAGATPPASESTLYATNVGGTATLLDAVGTHCPQARVLIVGSDAQYGPLPTDQIPTAEGAPMRPVAAYGRSKVLQERVALACRRMRGSRVICVRPFNHIGPGQSDRFVVASIARQIARAEAGLGPATIQVGRTDTARDFSDVRDVVRAYLACILNGRVGTVYNVGSGQARRIVTVAEMLVSSARVPIQLESVPGRTRTGDVLVTECDATRIRERTGWSPTISLEQTLLDILNYWRAQVHDEVSDTRHAAVPPDDGASPAHATGAAR